VPTDVLWLRRDLRVADHPALSAAAAADRLVCLFVPDPAILVRGRTAPARVAYLRDALEDLARRLAGLGSRLVVRAGDPTAVVPAVAAAAGATAVHVTADHTPFAVRRDLAVERALGDAGVALHRHPGVAIVEPGEVRTGSGDAFRVFSPFHRAWRGVDPGRPLPPPDRLPPEPDGAAEDPALAGEPIGDHPLLQATPPEGHWADGGETAARRRLDDWLGGGIGRYDDLRNVLGADGTSRLSPDLHLGCLSAREVHARLDRRRRGHDLYAKELAWRDFYLHVMAAWPESARTAFRPELRDLPWREDEAAFAAWAEGRTGYPVVDAAMRQLATTGWVHNRARMVVASFLCKDLLVGWRLGEDHFLRLLVDGDVASNNGGWQWAAGTGTDAQPFFRVFNPVTQGQRFDPDGAYVHRFVPELAGVPAPAVHSPWELTDADQRRYGVRIGVDYPAPIVDHAEARRRALAWFERHAAQPAAGGRAGR
jgi:deoxyribodipyrimidine photo-lyase